MSELDDFEAGLATIPLFERIGQPLDPAVPRLSSWDDWTPEEQSAERLALWLQHFHDKMVEGDATGSLRALFVRVRDRVIEISKHKVPYDADQDAYHAPTSAVWLAGGTAGVVALCVATRRALPPILEAQWDWYKAGRWPCSLATEPRCDDISTCRALRVL